MPERHNICRRICRILAYVCLLAALIVYGYLYHPGVTLSDCLASPEKYDDAVIEVGNEAKVEQVFDDGFTIRQLGRRVRVTGATKDVRPGEFILLLARFHKPSSLEAVKIHIAKNRRMKIWLSTIPVLLIVAFFIKSYRFDFRNFYFQQR